MADAAPPPQEDPPALQLTAVADDFFELALDHVVVAGLDGYFRRLNPAWSRTLGWTEEELLSRPSIEFVHPDDRAMTLADRGRLRDGGDLGPLVNRYLCRDGSFRWFEWRSAADPERGLVHAVARDVTVQKEAEAELDQAREREKELQKQLLFADRMASVGTLAAGIAHEINNPLAYVSGNLDLVLDDLAAMEADLPRGRLEDMLAMVGDAKEGAERIRRIVGGLRTFSRLDEEEDRRVVELGPMLDVAVNMTRNEIRHRARLSREDGPVPPVVADDARLCQVFINLLVNAAHAVGEERAAEQEIRILTETDAEGRAVITIEDSGPGIPEDVLPRIFDPFFTTKPVGLGTGLGLSICHNIVVGLGGSLTAANLPEGGTRFRVVLPAAKGAPEATGAVGAPSPVAGNSGEEAGSARAEVLVVDDEPAIGQILRKVLRNHEVTTVTAAPDALALLGQGRRYHVIFCDLMMPEMSGMEFHAELDRHLPEVARRVVFISGGAFTSAADAYLDQVPNERLAKPFRPDEVRALVQRELTCR